MHKLKVEGRDTWLAPMAGVTDLPFRLLCAEQGCQHTCTEMVSAKGWVLSPQNVSAKELLATNEKEQGLVSLQLFGHEPEFLQEAAAQLTERSSWSFVDINMGCPMPKIVGHGDGSALLRDVPLAEQVMRSVVRGSKVPVSIKLRIGYESDDGSYLRIAEAAERAGVSLITLHARTKAQLYSGHADWSAIRALKKHVTIPVIGNGDVGSAEDVLRMLDETGCDGVAIGRAARGNPWIFREAKALLEAKRCDPVTPQERLNVMRRHLLMLAEEKGEQIAVKQMRSHAVHYIHGMRGASALRQQINQISTIQVFTDTLTQFFMNQHTEGSL